jgi:uncharacterized protein (TIGR00159 family)
MSEKNKLTIIIVTYNSDAIINNCLTNISLEKNEVFVIDNNSSDKTLEIVANNFPAVKIIKNSKNIGFGRANNIGLLQITNDFALILNVDAQITEEDIEKTIEIMSKNPDIAIAGGVVHNCVIDENKKIISSYPCQKNLEQLKEEKPQELYFNKFVTMELFHIGFLSVRLLDLLDILIVSFLLYKAYQLLKGGTAINIFIGIVSMYMLWFLFVKIFEMQLLGAILGQFMSVGVLALIIVFQQEVRRFLVILGSSSFTGKDSFTRKILPWNWKEEQITTADLIPVIKACESMSNSKTGAILVLSRTTDLKFFENSGDAMDADLSKRLLESIFFKNSPLHDGAVIIRNNKIKAARCVLPVTDNNDLPAHLGMRHRAALGITEQSDAISIIVSEETGNISVAKNGVLENNLSIHDLELYLQREY